MAAGIATVKFNERDLRRIREQFSGVKGGMGKAMSRAINKTTMSARTQASREISGAIKLPVGVVRKSMDLQKASYSRWRGDLAVGPGKRIPLIRFGARQLKSGVTYQIDRTTGRKKIAGGFVQVVGAGHKGAFTRPGKSRFPIVQLYGPSVGRVFAGSSAIIRRVTREANKNLSKNIDVQVGLILGKLKRRAG